MNMATAVGIFKEKLMDVLPEDEVFATLVPEQDRFWRQNPSNSVLKFPTAVASLHLLIVFCLFHTRKKTTIFMANLHNPVCIVPVAGPKDGICCPQGITI